MAALLKRSRWWFGLLALLLAAWPTRSAGAGPCGVCAGWKTTLAGDINQADLVVIGRLTKAKAKPGEAAPPESTDLVIEVVLKKHALAKGCKVLPLDRVIPFTPGSNDRMLVFFEVHKGKLDAYRGVFVSADSDLDKYVQGIVKNKDQADEKRLRFHFDYLESQDATVAEDAFTELSKAGYARYRGMAAGLPADRIVKALTKPNRPASHLGLYGVLLGHCGKPEDAAVLRAVLDAGQAANSGIDGAMAGYVLLKPEEGWNYVRGILNDPQRDFLVRYGALRTARFFWEQQGKVAFARKAIAEAVAPLLEQEDIADMAVEDFRRWQCWDMADRVLALQTRPFFKTPIVHRAVLRYALSARDSTAARCFVQEQRRKDPELVKDVEELLQMEQK
jgi:hypothetical protein